MSNKLVVENGILVSGSVTFKGIPNQTAVNVLSYNTTTGVVTFMPTSSIQGGGSTVNGSGTATYIAIWSGSVGTSTTVSSSVVRQVNNNIGVGDAPVSSAKLSITSTTQGFLPPRLNCEEIKAITNPVPGLLLWCTDCADYPTGVLTVRSELNVWANLTSTSTIDCYYGWAGSDVLRSTYALACTNRACGTVYYTKGSYLGSGMRVYQVQGGSYIPVNGNGQWVAINWGNYTYCSEYNIWRAVRIDSNGYVMTYDDCCECRTYNWTPPLGPPIVPLNYSYVNCNGTTVYGTLNSYTPTNITARPYTVVFSGNYYNYVQDLGPCVPPTTTTTTTISPCVLSIKLSPVSTNCVDACSYISGYDFSSNQPVLDVGAYLFEGLDCITPAAPGYYSDRPTNSSTPSCYLVDSDGRIISKISCSL